MKYNKLHFEAPKFLYFRSSLVSYNFKTNINNDNLGYSNTDGVRDVTLMSNTVGSLLLKLFQILIANTKDSQYILDTANSIFSNFPSTLHIRELLIFYSYLYLGLDYLNRDITKRSIIREFWNFLIMEAPIPLSQYDKFSIKDLNEKDENELANEPFKMNKLYIIEQNIIPFILFDNYDPYNLYDWKDGEYQLLYKYPPQIEIEESYDRNTYEEVTLELGKDNPILLSLQFDALLCNNKFPQPFEDVINKKVIYKFATVPTNLTRVFVKLIVEVYNFIDNENKDKTKCRIINSLMDKEEYRKEIDNLLFSPEFRLDLNFKDFCRSLDLKNPQAETVYYKRLASQSIKHYLKDILEAFEEHEI